MSMDETESDVILRLYRAVAKLIDDNAANHTEICMLRNEVDEVKQKLSGFLEPNGPYIDSAVGEWGQP